MNRDDAIKIAAVAICKSVFRTDWEIISDGAQGFCSYGATSAIEALEAAGVVLVPKVPTAEMRQQVKTSDMLNGYESVGQLAIMWPMLLSASPYRSDK